MGVRHSFPLLLAAAVLVAACGEQDQDRESVTGPDFKPAPPANACDFSGLSGLIRDYFPGSSQNFIVSLKDAMATGGAHSVGARTNGFQIMDSVGSLSRNTAVATNPAAGASLTVGLIKCMFSDASTFTYPTTALADFTKALTSTNGGAYYVRGGGTAGVDPVGRTLPLLGTDRTSDAFPDPPTNLSGVKPFTGKTWTQVLTNATNAGSEYRALVYGYRVGAGADALVYEWATVPSGIEFAPGAVVAVCDGSNLSTTAMVHESTVGVLAFVPEDICDDTQPLTLLDGGWGARALASRLARVVADAISPAPLQAATVLLARSGSGGTATTFKSKFKTKSVETVGLNFTTRPPSVLRANVFTYDVVVRATTLVDNAAAGVNGVCIYLTGTNNNGVNTQLTGVGDADGCAAPENGGLVTKTRSEIVGGSLAAGYAKFKIGVTKTGGLVLTASSTNGTTTGVYDRLGQTFVNATIKVNVKP